LKALLKRPEGRLPRAVIFVSGTGTNAQKAIEQRKTWEPAVIVTDVKGCPAAALAEKFTLPLIEFDIADFYRQNGEDKVSLRTDHGRELREMWTEQLRQKLQDYQFDFGLLAGFASLSNITDDFPCLNVHPGDLTVENDQGERLLTGLHAIPIEKAILMGHNFLRSSVILALPYSDDGGDMDSGLILGVSQPVPVDLQGYSLEQLAALKAARIKGKKPEDALRQIAQNNQESLKIDGDWVVFPPVVNDFAAGLFSLNDTAIVYCLNNENLRVKTVEYGSGEKITPIK
jgi:folate-dependent phosphoribosylglycinamide formyltransferase PurN